MNMINTKEVFESYTNRINNVLDADTVKDSANGTGYLDGLTRLKNTFEEGDRAKFTDEHGRVGVVLFTDFGNVVIFQRYKDNDYVFVSNVAPTFKNVVPCGALNSEFVEWMLNSIPTNRAQAIVDDVMKAASKQLARHNKPAMYGEREGVYPSR
jgi:hypothetical protein